MIKGKISGQCQGFTLLELLLAMFLTAILMLGLVQLTTMAGSATRLQENQAALQDHARYISNLFFKAIAQAAFSPEPWNDTFLQTAIGSGTANDYFANSDRLVISTWSDRNCFDNINPERDAAGHPRFFIKTSVFDLNSSRHLSRTCRYGPSPESQVTQIRRQGLVPGIESFQNLFGEDTDNDGNVDRWVQAGQWLDEKNIIGIRIALLIASPDTVTPLISRTYKVLDTQKLSRPDGKLRDLIDMTLAIRSRSG